MEVVPLIVSVIALLSPFIAVWISHRKLRSELRKLSEEVENLRFQNEEARAAERKRVRSYADAVDMLTLGFDPWGDASQHDFSEFVLHHLPYHPSPLDVLVARVDNKGPHPIRNLVVSTTNFRPTAVSMNGEVPEISVRSPAVDLIPLTAGNSAVFTFPDVGAPHSSQRRESEEGSSMRRARSMRFPVASSARTIFSQGLNHSRPRSLPESHS